MTRELTRNVNLTAKQEKFCQNILAGMTHTDAYKNAYDCENMQIETITNNAYMLTKNSDIAARMLELYNMTAEPVIMDVKERKKRLSELARAKLVDFIDSDGNITTDGKNNAAIAELSVENFQGGKDGRAESTTKKIKLHNPIAAIQELNKMDGSYKVEQSNNQTIINIIVPDKETKNLLSNVVDNTKVIETGYKVLPETLPDALE
jgi:phage terminase small subunit